jgi:hypothetical protein
MADLKLTVSIDMAELEKGLAAAGKTIEKGMGSGGNGMKGVNFVSDILAGNVGSAIGGLFGPMGSAVGAVIDQIINKVRELAEYAKELRTVRLKTGLSYQEIEGLQAAATASGMSMSALADSMVAFKKNSADAFIKGNELTRLLPKLGVGLDELKDGSFGYFQAIEKLSAAHAAGTDEATLDYYAHALLGSSFKELLPLINMGTTNIRLYNESIYKNSTEAVDAMARFGDSFDIFVKNCKNGALELLGAIVAFAEKRKIGKLEEETSRYMNFMRKEADEGKGKGPDAKEAARFLIKEVGSGFTDEQRMVFARNASAGINNETDRKKFMDEFRKQLEQPGKKLDPFGFATAGAAYQMQQMGGGDFFGAISFTPLDAIKDNTDRAANTLDAMLALETGMGPSTPENINAK